MEINQDFQKYIDTLKETAQSNSSRNVMPTQATSCQELIAEAIQTLMDAQSACCDCIPPVGCQCKGSILCCLENLRVFFLGLPLDGSATLNAGVCLNCQNPITSDLIFSFLTNTNAFPFSFNSFTDNDEFRPTITCSSTSVTISGKGTLKIDSIDVLSNYTLTFSTVPNPNTFDLEIRTLLTNQVIFSAISEDSCGNVTIGPCS